LFRGPRRVRLQQLELLEVGLAWPPESFLRWKLEQLAARGLRVTVSACPDRDPQFQLRGVELVRQPDWDESGTRLTLGLLRDGLRVGLRSPRSLVAVLRAARRPIRHSAARSRRRRWRSAAERLRSYLPLARMRPDIVHFEWATAAIHYLPLLETWGCPAVLSCHGSDINVRPHAPTGRDFRHWLRKSFDRVSGVHCVSKTIWDAAAALGMDERQAWLIHPGVDPAYFTPRGSGSEQRAELRVVSVADLHWLKGHHHALRAIRLLADLGVPVRFDLVGKDLEADLCDRDRIAHTIVALGLRDRVRLWGGLPTSGVLRRLQDADVLLHTSLTEGLPTAVLEAMACGLPVVVTDCGGIREAVTDGVEGFVVPLRASEQAASCLQALHEDPALRQTMGSAGRARVESQFTLERHLDAFVEMYSRVVGAAPSVPHRRTLSSPRHRASHARAFPASACGALGPAQGPGLRLVSMTSLSWSQGLDDAMQAVSLLRERGISCRYRIVGEGIYGPALWFTRHQLGLEGEVEFQSSPGPERWDEHLQWADVLVDASLADPPREALAHAQAAGVEVISTSHELDLGDGQSRMHHSPAGEPQALADVIASRSMKRRPALERVSA
jgi:glycosyltransferase involved in cell wall biosynthesis